MKYTYFSSNKSKDKIECPSCGEINDALSEKCHKCGYILEVLKKCSICKKLTSKYLNSCDKCHNELYIQCLYQYNCINTELLVTLLPDPVLPCFVKN